MHRRLPLLKGYGSKAMIKVDLANKFIEQVKQNVDYNINIMNEQGYIIASCDPQRVGTFHEIAYHILNGKEDMISVDGEHDYPGVLPGINMAIMIDGRKEGVIGVTGEPKNLRSVALFTKISIEAMLRYEHQQSEQVLRQSQKEKFINMLINEEHPDPGRLRKMAEDLGYTETIVRIPILCLIPGGGAEEKLELLKKSEKHSKEDISFVLDEETILIYKAVSNNGSAKAIPRDKLFMDYKYMIINYLQTMLHRDSGEEGAKSQIRFFVGTFQNSFPQYYYGYQHCRWLMETAALDVGAAFFYDYTREYLQQIIPMKELQHVFYPCLIDIMDELSKNSFTAIIDALIRSNWNFNEAARKLFMHKNTLVYKYNKIKYILNINPVVSSEDRSFVEALFYYLNKNTIRS